MAETVQENEDSFLSELKQVQLDRVDSVTRALDILNRVERAVLVDADPGSRHSLLEGIDAVLHAMKMFQNEETVHTVGCRLLRTFSIDETDSANFEVVKALLLSMRTFDAAAAVQEEGCGALAMLSQHLKLGKQIAASGGIELVVLAMKRLPRAVQVQEAGCSVLGNLLTQRGDLNAWEDEGEQIDPISEGGTIEVVFDAVRHHPHAQGVQNAGRRALDAWALSAAADDNSVLAVLGIMDKFTHEEAVQTNGCAVLQGLAFDLNHKSAMIRLGGPELVLNAMTSHAASGNVQKQGCAVLWSLAFDDEGKHKLQQLGGIEVVLQALRSHPTEEGVLEQGCGALQHLVDDAHMQQVVSSGGVDLVVTGMRMHPQARGVQQQGCCALQSLALASKMENIDCLGVVELVVQAMQRHTGAEMQIAGCRLLRTVAENDHGSAIAKSSGIEEVIEAMQNHTESAEVQEEGCGVLAALSGSAEYDLKIADLRVIETVVAAMSSHIESEGLQALGCQVIGKLALHEDNGIKIQSLGGLEAVVKAISQHPASEGVKDAGNRALQNWTSIPARYPALLNTAQSSRQGAKQPLVGQDASDASAAITFPAGWGTQKKRTEWLRKAVLWLEEGVGDDREEFKVGGQAIIERGTLRGETVAVKRYVILREHSREEEQALTEAWLLRTISEDAQGAPHVVHCHGVQTEQHGRYRDVLLVLELAPNGSLDEILYDSSRQNLSDGESSRRTFIEGRQTGWLAGIAEALRFLHSKLLTHCDVKAANVLLYDDGRTPKLADFGSAVLGKGNSWQHSLPLATQQNARITVRYVAPEHEKENSPLTTACDVWAFGVLMFEILFAVKAWSSIGDATRDVARLQQAKLNMSTASMAPTVLAVQDPRKKLPLAVAVMERCWVADPTSRPDMTEVALSLSKYKEPVVNMGPESGMAISGFKTGASHSKEPVAQGPQGSGTMLVRSEPAAVGQNDSGLPAKGESTLGKRKAAEHTDQSGSVQADDGSQLIAPTRQPAALTAIDDIFLKDASTETNVVKISQGCQVTFAHPSSTGVEDFRVSRFHPIPAVKLAGSQCRNWAGGRPGTPLILSDLVYRLEPSGTRFHPPATLRLPYDAEMESQLSELGIEAQAGVFRWSEEDVCWKEVGKARKISDTELEVPTGSFSLFSTGFYGCVKQQIMKVGEGIMKVLSDLPGKGSDGAQTAVTELVSEGAQTAVTEVASDGVDTESSAQSADKQLFCYQQADRIEAERSFVFKVRFCPVVQRAAAAASSVGEGCFFPCHIPARLCVKLAGRNYEEQPPEPHMASTGESYSWTEINPDGEGSVYFVLKYSPKNPEDSIYVWGNVHEWQDGQAGRSLQHFFVEVPGKSGQRILRSQSCKIGTPPRIAAFFFRNRDDPHFDADWESQCVRRRTFGVYDFHPHSRPSWDDFLSEIWAAEKENTQIVHLAGHGHENGLDWVNEDGKASELGDPQAIAKHIGKQSAANGKSIACVVINACHSKAMGHMMQAKRIPRVICWDGAVDEKDARSFADKFYFRLGNLSESTGGENLLTHVDQAFEEGKEEVSRVRKMRKAQAQQHPETSTNRSKANTKVSLDSTVPEVLLLESTAA